MTTLQQKVKDYGVRRVSQEIKTAPVNVRHFINKRYRKIGRKTRAAIRNNFIERGWITPPKPRPKCKCPVCHKVHAQGKHRNAADQSQTPEKISAST